MDNTLNNTDETVMKLLHYFITDQGYNPIVLHGAKNEIWLENIEKPYKIVRIVTNYIHNNEQLDFDIYRTKEIAKRIKKKTFTFNMNVLSLFINLGENANLLEEMNKFDKVTAVKIDSVEDLNRYQFIIEDYPDIIKESKYTENGMELFMKITDDINKKNIEDNKKVEDVFKEKKPIVTYALIALNVLMFLFAMFIDNKLTGNSLYKLGAITNDVFKTGEFYRLFTAMFLHAGLIHLFCNMYSLYIIGPQIESFYGRGKYIAIYLISGLVGTLFSILFLNDYTVSVGASGAIFGLLGSLLYFGYHYRIYLGGFLKSQIIPLVILNLLIGLGFSGIDNWAHIGGLIGGVFVSMAVGVKYKSTKFERVNGLIVLVILICFISYLSIGR